MHCLIVCNGALTRSWCSTHCARSHADTHRCGAAPGGPPQASPVRVVYKSKDRAQTVYVLVKESSAFKPTFLQVRTNGFVGAVLRACCGDLLPPRAGCSVPRARASGAPALCAAQRNPQRAEPRGGRARAAVSTAALLCARSRQAHLLQQAASGSVIDVRKVHARACAGTAAANA